MIGTVCCLLSSNSTFTSSGAWMNAIDVPPACFAVAISSFTSYRSGAASVCVIIA